MNPTDDDIMRAIATYLGIVAGDKYQVPMPDMPGPSWLDSNWEPLPGPQETPSTTGIENPMPEPTQEVTNADAGTAR